MGEAKRRAEAGRAPVTIVPGDDRWLSEGRARAANLMAAAEAMNRRTGETRKSAALSTAIQMLVLQDRDAFTVNDLTNALCSATAWALHPIASQAWEACLDGMREHILAMAKDSAQAAALMGTPDEGAGHA